MLEIIFKNCEDETENGIMGSEMETMRNGKKKRNMDSRREAMMKKKEGEKRKDRQ